MNARNALSTYRAKRHFDVTAEPSGDAGAVASDQPRFMVHKHDATRLHYDVRLEIDGVLASWACPKGPSYDPAQKRLAVQTEDHPLEYGDFEGRIPDGEYGAGDSLIWDRGTWDTVPPGQAVAQRKKGHLHLALRGEKLVGEWHLIRTRGQGGKDQWLMFKAKDGTERDGYDVVAERPESVVSGRRVTRGPVHKAKFHPAPESLLKKVAADGPMLATLSEPAQAPASDYFYEVKYDGFRAIAAVAGGKAVVVSRNGLDLLDRFPWAAEALAHLETNDAVLDGELVVLDAHGRSGFAHLGDVQGHHRFIAFDLLWLDGQDLRARPVEERRALLESVVANAGPLLQLAEKVEGTAEEALAAAAARKLEGVIAKRKGSPWESGRSTAWRKLKTHGTADLAIAGYTLTTGRTDSIGALLLAQRKDDRWVFAGKVGTGFTAKVRKSLLGLLEKDEIGEAAIDGAPRLRAAHWVTPKHIAQLEFMEWTRDGKLRHPSFQGLRDDKAVDETGIDAGPAAKGLFLAKPITGFGVWHSNQTEAEPPIDVPRTSQNRILFPKAKLTKGDVRDYYEAVAAPIVAAMKGRALAMEQWPQGIEKPGFFRHTAKGAPDWIRVEAGHLVIDRPETVAWLANQSALTFHMPGARVGTPDAPDWAVVDFDPAGDDFSEILPLALALKGLLDELKLASYPKTSGKRGLHVFIPVGPGHTWAQIHGFARSVADVLAAKFPEVATTERMKKQRHGRLYLDAEQNAPGKTIVAPYSIRATERAQVSAPLTWDEVDAQLRPAQFTIRSMPNRLRAVGDLFAPVLRSTQRLPVFKE